MSEIRKERITLEDTALTAIAKLSEGNPGAVTVCAQLYSRGAEIDPDAWCGPLSALLSLDSYGIYGSRIWGLYKDICKENIVKTVAVLRAVQLGFESEEKLKHAIENRGDGINVEDLFAKVCDRLTGFGEANVLEATEVG